MTRESIVTVAGERYRAVEDPPHTFTIFLQAGARLGQIVRVPAAGNQREYFQTEYRRDHVTTWTDAVLTLHRDYLVRDMPTAVPPPPPLPAAAPLAAQDAPQAPPPAAEGAQDDDPPAAALGAVLAPPPPADPPGAGQWLSAKEAAPWLDMSYSQLTSQAKRGQLGDRARKVTQSDARGAVRSVWAIWVPEPGTAPAAVPADTPRYQRPVHDTDKKAMLAALLSIYPESSGLEDLLKTTGLQRDRGIAVLKALVADEQVVATGQPGTRGRRYWAVSGPRPTTAPLPAPAPEPAESGAWLRTPQAAARLGISRESVGERARAGQIPSRRVPWGKRQVWEVWVPDAPPTTPADDSVPLASPSDETTESRATGLIEWAHFPQAPVDPAKRNIIPAAKNLTLSFTPIYDSGYTPPAPAAQPTLREIFQLLWETHDGQDELLIAVKDALRPILLALPVLRNTLDSVNAAQDQVNSRIMNQTDKIGSHYVTLKDRLDRVYDQAEYTQARATETSTRTQDLLDRAEQTAAAEAAAATWMETTSGQILSQGRAIQLMLDQVAAQGLAIQKMGEYTEMQAGALSAIHTTLIRLETQLAAQAEARREPSGWSLFGNKGGA